MLVMVPRASVSKFFSICNVVDGKVTTALTQDGFGQSTATTAVAVLQGVPWCTVACGVMCIGLKRRRGADLIDLFEDEQSDSIIINYGENTINTRQINRQINEDLYWAVLSMVFAAAMLRLGSGSWFMTAAGLFQIIVRSRCLAPLLGATPLGIEVTPHMRGTRPSRVTIGVCCLTDVRVLFWTC